MASFTKWLGAGLGFTFGGPIGAALGFAIGSFVGGFSKEDLTEEQREYQERVGRDSSGRNNSNTHRYCSPVKLTNQFSI